MSIRNFIKCLQGGLIHHFYSTKKRKVIVIGLSRTGTTSITSAMDILGMKGHHYPSMCFQGEKPLWLKGNTLIKNDVFTDISVIPFYKYYYKKFPNALFILTDRNKEAWLDSMNRKPNLNDAVERNSWKDKLRAYLYGTAKFTRENYDAAFINYYQDARAFFKKNDNSRLLEMNITAGDGWEKLCQFLNCETPDAEFPLKNRGYRK